MILNILYSASAMEAIYSILMMRPSPSQLNEQRSFAVLEFLHFSPDLLLDAARKAAERAAKEQVVPGSTTGILTKTRKAIGMTRCRRAEIDPRPR